MRMTAIHLTMLGAVLVAMPAMAQNATINGGDPVANQADAIASPRVDTLLTQAGEAARAGRLPLANELVERAETLTLTRSTIAGTEGTPVSGGAVAKMAAARAALSRRDVSTATMLMAEAASMSRGM